MAAVKHVSHGYDMDREGKDSWRLRGAGADVVAVAGEGGYTVHRFDVASPGLSDVLEGLKNVDVVVVEGFKREPGPKIELVRKGISPSRLQVSDLVAVVTDVPDLKEGLPCFTYNEIDELANYLIDLLGLADGKKS